MEIKETITNEKIRKKFKNQFDLVNYAIKLAENMIKSGRDARVKVESQNRASQLLAEITVGKDQFDVIPEVAVEVGVVQMKTNERETESRQTSSRRPPEKDRKKSSVRKAEKF